MSYQDTIEQPAISTPRQPPQYNSVGSEFTATTGNTPQMTFVWSAKVTWGHNPQIAVSVNYGIGSSTPYPQTVFIPWGSTAAVPIPAGPSSDIMVQGSVKASYANAWSVVITFAGRMVYLSYNDIDTSGVPVAALLNITPGT